MANGIGRLRLKGISKQPTFNTESTSVDFFIPSDDAFLIEPDINKAENAAAVGSAYGVVDVQNTTRMATFPLNFKVDENLFALFFLQRYTVSSTTDNGDDTYEHALKHTNETQNWFTVFMQDDQRTDYLMKNVLFDGLNLNVNASEHITLAGTGNGNYPSSTDVTVSSSDPKTFTGVHADFLADDFGGTVSSVAIETMTANHTFNLSARERNFDIGNEDISFHQINTSRFELEFTGKLGDRNEYDIYTANTERVYRVKIVDTSRTIGTASRNPSIQLDYPIGRPISYSDAGDLDTNLTFNANYLAVDRPSVPDSPMAITVVNETSSY